MNFSQTLFEGYVNPLAARANRVTTTESIQASSTHQSKYKLFTEKDRFPLKRRGAGDIIVPRDKLQHKPRHIESAIAVNGTSRAMQGSDYMRLRAREKAKSRSADGEPETANSYFAYSAKIPLQLVDVVRGQRSEVISVYSGENSITDYRVII